MKELRRNETHNDFNCSLGNLGRDGKCLEERSLLGAQACVLGFNVYWTRSQSTGTSRSTDSVLGEPITDIHQIILGEDKSNIASDVREKPARRKELVIQVFDRKSNEAETQSDCY